MLRYTQSIYLPYHKYLNVSGSGEEHISSALAKLSGGVRSGCGHRNAKEA